MGMPIESIIQILDYLEHDERKDYQAYAGDAASQKNHIYTHIRRVREWLNEELEGTLVPDTLENNSIEKGEENA